MTDNNAWKKNMFTYNAEFIIIQNDIVCTTFFPNEFNYRQIWFVVKIVLTVFMKQCRAANPYCHTVELYIMTE